MCWMPDCPIVEMSVLIVGFLLFPSALVGSFVDSPQQTEVETHDWLLSCPRCSHPSFSAANHHVSFCVCVFFREPQRQRGRLFAAHYHPPSPTLPCVKPTAAKGDQDHLAFVLLLSHQNRIAPSYSFRLAHTLLFRQMFGTLQQRFCSILCWGEPGDPAHCRGQQEEREPPPTLLTSGDYLPSCPSQPQQPGEIWVFGLS